MVSMAIVLALMVAFCAAAVMIKNLVKAAISLALASVCLTVVLFMLGIHWAALFELSVCAGLITVIFVSAISLTVPHKKEEEKKIAATRLKRYIQLPFVLVIIMLVAGFTLMMGSSTELLPTVSQSGSFSVFKEIFWHNRQIDILGQIIVILSGVFAVVILFKESDKP
ncbi:MAG: NADH-quinone oxidoreductase subunit J [Bacillota bacterium]|jgi:NADH-quinone oxidoreductase subunit J